MSGLSLAVGPRDGEPQERAREQEAKGLMGSVRTIELQLVAFIVVFSASGLVPIADLLFPVFVSFYLFILTRIVFPSYNKEGSRMEVFHNSRMFQLYVVLGTAIGLFFPLSYVLGAFARGDQRAVRAATPHLFLLSVQILSENIISSLAICSPPVRAVLAVLYTARRIFSLADWVGEEFYNTSLPAEPSFRDFAWSWFGRGLAAGNFIYFNVNMFCFIIPRFLPRAFERYLAAKAAHSAANRAMGKHDKPSTTPPKENVEKKSK